VCDEGLNGVAVKLAELTLKRGLLHDARDVLEDEFLGGHLFSLVPPVVVGDQVLSHLMWPNLAKTYFAHHRPQTHSFPHLQILLLLPFYFLQEIEKSCVRVKVGHINEI
jgi:membrane-bound metal-dependent hydrolase YbcI (DUF457 family)